MSNFLYRLLPHSAWVLCAVRGDNKSFQTFTPDQRSRALDWMECFPGAEIKVLAGNPNRMCLSNPTIDHVRDVIAIGIRAPLSKAKAILSLRDAPAIAFPYDGKLVAVWRFRKPIPPRDADRAEQDIADKLGGKPTIERLNFFVPIPRRDLADVERFTDATIDPKDIAALSVVENTTERKFTRGDEDDDEAAAQDIHENWLASENFTYYVGRPKQGKSLAVAKTAAYITAGGTWDGNGKWTDKWFDGTQIAPYARGSVIILEEEDPTAQTKARCRAAGCNMAKVHIRKLVPHISVKEQLSEITDLAEELGDCRLISFSPIQSAILSAGSVEQIVRAEFRPLLRWAAGRGIALIGVLHTTKDGKALAGSDVLFRIARCVVAFEDGTMEVRDSNIGPTGMPTPFKVETVISKAVKTARIAFVEKTNSASQDASSGASPESVKDRAVAALHDLLQSGPIPSNLALEKMRNLGFSDNRIYAAKSELKIPNGVKGKIASWELPKDHHVFRIPGIT